MAGQVKLIGSRNSLFSSRPRVALNLKAWRTISYRRSNGGKTQKSELLLESNPVYKKIPVLIHNGEPVCESMIILEYIDETWRSATSPSILLSFPALSHVLMGPNPNDKPGAIEKFVSSLQLLEEVLEHCCKGKSFFCGDEIGYLDIAIGAHFGWIEATEILIDVKLLDEEKVPRLVDWFERYCSHPAVKNVVPTTDELIKFVAEIKSSLNAS